MSSKDTPSLSTQDVGLIFVREYYTFLHKKPNQLYAFYNEDSLLVRGDEGTISTTFKGQEEIRKKIEESEFKDCKVLITQVDSQASANNGILVQVLGEMCNNNGPLQKFSQTFYLATQTNGYYVLNDICRFLKDEVPIENYTYEKQQEQEPTPNHITAKKEPIAPVSPIVEHVEVEHEPEVIEVVSKKEKVDNTPVTQPEVEPVEEKTTEEPKPAPKIITPVIPDTPVMAVAPATPETPSKPKSWAHLTAASTAINNSSTAVEKSPSSTPTPTPTSPAAAVAAVSLEKSNTKLRKGEATQIFIKSVIESITEEALLDGFNKIAKVKVCNIVRNKNCAFMEFTTSEGCQKALEQHKVELNGGHTVTVEERKYTNHSRYQLRPFEQRRSNNHRKQQRQQQNGKNKNINTQS